MTQKAPMPKPLTADEIRAQHEINGARRANTNLLAYALEQLKSGDDRGSNLEKLAAMTLEREKAVIALRRLAELYGESEWPEGLSLPEIIDKHIALPIAALLAAASERPDMVAKAPEKSKR
ncbi:MAG TPA: hypothetical protein VK550_12180 [Polyangiaceae bacterium]|nr:hypothetical protein [Polyangiaceae bacterium]